MKKLRIGIAEVLSNRPADNAFKRIMLVNFSSIMPQAIAVWCEQKGHEVFFTQYAGSEIIGDPLPTDLDVVFVSAFTSFAQIAYALSNLFQSHGAVTALGGPHARSYPEDSAKYFDYVLGLTDQQVIADVLEEAEPRRPEGIYLSASQQPPNLPGVRERWKYLNQILKHSPWLKAVPVLGSFGCPYQCSFCVDSVVPYQPVEFEALKEDYVFCWTI